MSNTILFGKTISNVRADGRITIEETGNKLVYQLDTSNLSTYGQISEDGQTLVKSNVSLKETLAKNTEIFFTADENYNVTLWAINTKPNRPRWSLFK